jgi:hypothetical protein
MPRGPAHDKQKSKNYAVMLALLAFIATVFFVTIIRMKGS